MAFFCLAATLWVLRPLWNLPDWYFGHQAYRYPYLLLMFKQQFLAGHWYPRWLPDLFGGYGYPTFIYYPPGFWFLTLPVSLLIADPVLACKITLTALVFASGLGAYKLARCYCSRIPALAAAGLYYLTPYLGFSAFFRGSLSELTAMLLMPWVFYHLVQLMRQHARHAPLLSHTLWLAVLIAAIVYAHPMITVWMALTLTLCVLARLADHPRSLILPLCAILALVALLALALSASYWYPSLTLKDYVTYQNGVHVGQFKAVANVIGLNSSLDGLGLPFLAIAGFIVGWRFYMLRACLFCTVLFIAYIMGYSSELIRYFPPLGYLQMPIRTLALLATLQLIGYASLLSWLETRYTPRHIAYGSLLLLSFLTVTGYHAHRLHELDFDGFYRYRMNSFEDMTHGHEFQPRSATITALDPRLTSGAPLIEPGPGITIESTRNNANADLDISIQSTGPASLTVNQWSFPGWLATADNEPLADCLEQPLKPALCNDDRGRMVLTVPAAGHYQLHLWYDGVPDADTRNLLMALVASLSLAGLWRLCPKPKAHSPAPSETL